MYRGKQWKTRSRDLRFERVVKSKSLRRKLLKCEGCPRLIFNKTGNSRVERDSNLLASTEAGQPSMPSVLSLLPMLFSSFTGILQTSSVFTDTLQTPSKPSGTLPPDSQENESFPLLNSLKTCSNCLLRNLSF